jgi:hypothetical protein
MMHWSRRRVARRGVVGQITVRFGELVSVVLANTTTVALERVSRY